MYVLCKSRSPSKVAFVVDQAMNTLKLLKNGEAKLIVDDKVVRAKSVCLWLILERKGRIKKLSEFDSLIFKWKLADWIKRSQKFRNDACCGYKLSTSKIDSTAHNIMRIEESPPISN